MVQGSKSAHFPEHSVSILDFVLSMIELLHSIAYLIEQFLSIIRQGLIRRSRWSGSSFFTRGGVCLLRSLSDKA